MSALQSRYRNGVTNIGMICGFATNTEDGGLHLLTNGCTEMGWTLERSEGARAAKYDFEPVVAVCQMEPPEDEWVHPHVRALYVTRMPRRYLPKQVVWFARNWPYTSDYTPYGERFHSWGYSDTLLNALVDELDVPDWLQDMFDTDSAIAGEIQRGPRKRYLPNRWVLTGRVVSGACVTPVETPANERPTAYFPLQLWQPGDSTPFHLRIKITKRDARQLERRPLNMHATVLCRGRTRVLEHTGERLLRAHPVFSVDEILLPSELDAEVSP